MKTSLFCHRYRFGNSCSFHVCIIVSILFTCWDAHVLYMTFTYLCRENVVYETAWEHVTLGSSCSPNNLCFCGVDGEEEIETQVCICESCWAGFRKQWGFAGTWMLDKATSACQHSVAESYNLFSQNNCNIFLHACVHLHTHTRLATSDRVLSAPSHPAEDTLGSSKQSCRQMHTLSPCQEKETQRAPHLLALNTS